MEIDVLELLRREEGLLLFFVIAVGYLVGNLRLGSFSLGPTGGVLFAGLALGHYGFELSPLIGKVGFILFIYSVGIEAGPRFSSVLSDGGRYLGLALVVTFTGTALALLLAAYFEFEPGVAAGMLAGSLTSSPTLAAAQDTVSEMPLPPGLSRGRVAGNVTSSYAITYVFGLAGMILLVRLLPRILGIDLAREAAKVASLTRSPGEQTPPRAVAVRAFRVTGAELSGRTVGSIEAETAYQTRVERIKRGGEMLEPTPETVIQEGDLVAGFGYEDMLVSEGGSVQEVRDPDLLQVETETCEMVVTKPDVSGQTLRDVGPTRKYGCFVTKIKRLGIRMPLQPDFRLQQGDVLTVVGPSRRLNALGEVLGHLERQVDETDLLTFALGICLGLAVGAFSLRLGNISIGLGSAGGLLLFGILVGWLRTIRPTFGRVPTAVRWVFRELGLLLFMASVGLSAGAGIVETLSTVGLPLFLSGISVTTLPVFVGYLFGRLVLKLNPVLLFGGITGAMTSTPSLNALTSEAKSPVPGLGYTGAYAFANVLLTLAGTFMVRL